jgi:putative transposase
MMSEDTKALFRYRTIAPLCDPDLCWGDKTRLMKAIADKVHTLPCGTERRFSIETIRAWDQRYRTSGFEALKTKPRRDKGTFRAANSQVIEKACELKREQPKRSLLQIIEILEQEQIIPGDTLKKSTLHRILQHHQLTEKVPKSKAYWQRYQASFPNDLWQSDQMHGPQVVDPNNPSKTIHAQLLAWIDDHSRVICHAQFYPQAKLGNLEHALRKGIQKMGLPKMIYTDNGKVYSAKHLGTACAHLGIRLVYATPYCPQGKGKIERFFGTVRSSFLPEVDPSRIQTLEALNTAFWAWLEIKYQNKVHSQIKATPKEAFLKHKDRIRWASLEQIRNAFLYREKRKIHKDCTFQLAGNYYEVMPALAKQDVEVVFDPDNMEEVKVYLAGSFFQQARLLRVPPRRRKKDIATDTAPDTGIDYLSGLVEQHQHRQSEELFGPKAQVDDISTSVLIDVFDRMAFPPFSEFERNLVLDYERRFGPFDPQITLDALQTIVILKGYEHHIQVYLDKLVDIHRGGQSS